MVYQTSFLSVLLSFLLPSLPFFLSPFLYGCTHPFCVPMNTKEGHWMSFCIFLYLIPLRQALSPKACCQGKTDWSKPASSLHLVLTSSSGYKFINMLVHAWLLKSLSIGYRQDFGLHGCTVSILIHWTIFSAFYGFPSAEICFQPLTHLLNWARRRRWKDLKQSPNPQKSGSWREEARNSTRIGIDGGMVGELKDTNLLTQSYLFWRPPLKILYLRHALQSYNFYISNLPSCETLRNLRTFPWRWSLKNGKVC